MCLSPHPSPSSSLPSFTYAEVNAGRAANGMQPLIGVPPGVRGRGVLIEGEAGFVQAGGGSAGSDGEGDEGGH